MIMSQFSGSAEYTPESVGPTGPPVSPTMYSYSGGFIGIQWTNGDSSAETEVAFVDDNTRTIEPSSPSEIQTKVSPGVTGWESEQSADTCTWYVRHKKGGQTTAWVIATLGPFECDELL